MGNIPQKWGFCPSARRVQTYIKAEIKRMDSAKFTQPTVQRRAGKV